MVSLTWALILEVLIVGVTLAIDAFAVSITDGLCYHNLKKSRGILIPATFGVFQAVMPLIGFFIAYAVGLAFGEIFSKIDHWIGFVLLAFVGGKMIFDAVKELRSKEEEVQHKQFSFVEVLVQGVATSIDALLIGVGFAANETMVNHLGNIFISVGIIGVVTFVISLVGLIIGVKVGNIFKNKTSIAEIIGGVVLIGLSLKILIEGLLES